jgi:hypothetical protein
MRSQVQALLQPWWNSLELLAWPCTVTGQSLARFVLPLLILLFPSLALAVPLCLCVSPWPLYLLCLPASRPSCPNQELLLPEALWLLLWLRSLLGSRCAVHRL